MKRIIAASVLSLSLAFGGCVTATSTTPPAAIAPGYRTDDGGADQRLGTILAGATAAYNTLHDDQASGKYKPTAAEVTALNILQSALAAAEPIYLNYHNGIGTLAAAQNAVDKVSSAQTNAQNLIGVK